MNTKQLKQLIKEAVKEVIKEELSEILKEAILNRNETKQLVNEEKTFSLTTDNIQNNGVRNAFRSQMNEMYGIGIPKSTSIQPKKLELEPITEENKNPYLKFFAETAQNMTAQDRSALSRLD